ncbi:MAG TPA: hypothetical protein VHL11_05975, partial [Phototrophicaceae bacterium]|nr:hypothetical protein [Phototrophicaceae bacterium]
MKNSFVRSIAVGMAALLSMLLLTIQLTSAQPSTPLPRPDRGTHSTRQVNPGAPQSFKAMLDAQVKARQEHRTHANVTTGTAPLALPGLRAAPANDNLANAAVVSIPGSATVPEIEQATLENGKLPFCYGKSQDVWFKLTVATETTVDIDLTGSDYDTVLSLHSGPASATLQSELSFINCNDQNNDDTSALYGMKLKPGTYYLQVSEYSDGTVDPATLQLSIEVSGKPLPFYYEYPYPGTFAAVPDAYVWDISELATTYDFTMNKTSGAAQIFKLTDLTPAVDDDELECHIYDYCVLTLSSSDQALLTDLNDYQWIVDAKNTVDTTQAFDDADNVFSLDFSSLPETPYLYSNIPELLDTDPIQYEWSSVIDAETYTLAVDQIAPVVDAGVIVLANLTPEADADGLICTLYYNCVLTLDPASVLADESTNLWSVTANNSNGGTGSDTDTFDVDFTPVPGAFYLYTLDLIYNIDELNFAFGWQISDYAETYALNVNQTSPDSTTVIDLEGLTPAQDSDGLSCDIYECYYYTSDLPSLFINGDYTWTASATNANGTTVGDGSPNAFTLNTDIAFDLISPVPGAVFNSSGEIIEFSWEQVSAPLTTNDNWELGFYGDYEPGPDYNLRDLTEAADIDPLTCTAGTCTLAATGTQMGL